MWVTLDFVCRKLFKSGVFWTAEVDRSVQHTRSTSTSLLGKFDTGRVIPVFLHEGLQGADCAFIHRLATEGVRGAQIVVECWKMQKALQQTSTVAIIARTIKNPGSCALQMARPFGDATVGDYWTFWNIFASSSTGVSAERCTECCNPSLS